jgi:hypothetical protein
VSPVRAAGGRVRATTWSASRSHSASAPPKFHQPRDRCQMARAEPLSSRHRRRTPPGLTAVSTCQPAARSWRVGPRWPADRDPVAGANREVARQRGIETPRPDQGGAWHEAAAGGMTPEARPDPWISARRSSS